MAERPAVNASPLIHLAAAGRIDLLRVAGAEIVVPAAVASEIRRFGRDDPTVKALDETVWLHVEAAPPIPPEVLRWDLGEGESAVLAWAIEYPGTLVIIDDLAARRCAAVLGILVRGTLGLVLTAKKRGVIPAARPVVDLLRMRGMYLDDALADKALALVGE